MVAELARCQKANRNGYLSAYPEAQFEMLAAGISEWPKVWAPFYTYHKIMAGMLDMYVHTGNEQALAVAEGHGGLGAALTSSTSATSSASSCCAPSTAA